MSNTQNGSLSLEERLQLQQRFPNQSVRVSTKSFEELLREKQERDIIAQRTSGISNIPPSKIVEIIDKYKAQIEESRSTNHFEDEQLHFGYRSGWEEVVADLEDLLVPAPEVSEYDEDGDNEDDYDEDGDNEDDYDED